jgi:hypothetical protein
MIRVNTRARVLVENRNWREVGGRELSGCDATRASRHVFPSTVAYVYVSYLILSLAHPKAIISDPNVYLLVYNLAGSCRKFITEE